MIFRVAAEVPCFGIAAALSLALPCAHELNSDNIHMRALHSIRLRRSLERWYRVSVDGNRLNRQLDSELAGRLEDIFGYNLLFIGVDPGLKLSAMTRVRQLIAVSPDPAAERPIPLHIIANDEELPIETESIDIVVACNTLDLSDDPHQVLREIRRVLTPHGQLILIGFNPNSLLGLVRSLSRRQQNAPWRALRALPPHRVTDWLSLIDFDCDVVSHKQVIPVPNGGYFGKLLQRLDDWLCQHHAPFGSSYIIQAHKLVRGHLHPKASSRARPRLISLPAAKPIVGSTTPTSQQPRKLPPNIQ